MREDDQTAHSQSESEGGLQLSSMLDAVKRSALLIAVLVVVSTLVAVAVTMNLPNRYDASSTVQIDPRRKSIANVEGAMSDLRADSFTVDGEVEVIKSKDTLIKVIELLNLREDPEFTAPGLYKRLMQRFGFGRTDKPGPVKAARPDDSLTSILTVISPGSAEPEKDEVALAVADRMKVQRVRSTSLIEIRFSSQDPVKAARIANAIAEAYIKDQIEDKAKAANQAAALLEDKLGDLRRRVGEAEYKVEQFKAQNNIFDAGGSVLSEKNLTRIQEQALAASTATTEAKVKYEQARRVVGRGGSKGDIAEVLQSATIRQRKDELARLTRREAELLTRYGDRHPEILKIKAEIADATAQLNDEVDRLVENLKNDYETALDREGQLTASLQEAKEKQVQTKEALITLNALQRESLTSRQLFEALLVRYKQMAEVQDLQLADARVVERASVPLSPSAPKRKLIILAALVGSLGFGIALALALDMLAPGIARAEDVKRVLHHDHIGSLPAVSGSRERLRAMRLMLAEPDGIFAETIRGLRHEVDARWRAGTSRVIMLASSLPNEGRSAVASNLAHQLALTGQRTLLVDGDLRKASLTRVLCPAGVEVGASDCLEQGLPVENAILRDQATGLCFLPAFGFDAALSNPAEWLASSDMDDMIERLRLHFDAIVLDCPPLLPVVDARIMADFADQIVFVTSWRKTPKELARRGLRTLGKNESKVIGVVLNQVDETHIVNSRSLGAGMNTAPMSLPKAA